MQRLDRFHAMKQWVDFRINVVQVRRKHAAGAVLQTVPDMFARCKAIVLFFISLSLSIADLQSVIEYFFL